VFKASSFGEFPVGSPDSRERFSGLFGETVHSIDETSRDSLHSFGKSANFVISSGHKTKLLDALRSNGVSSDSWSGKFISLDSKFSTLGKSFL